MDEDDEKEREVGLGAFSAALRLQLRVGELMMKVDQSQLTDAERLEFQSIAGTLTGLFKAVGQVMQTTSNEDVHKQALASSEKLREETQRAINLLERLIAKQS
jgi:hypothetical protein